MNYPIKVFRYIQDLDCFLPTEEYAGIAKTLGLGEWSPVDWIGRYLTLDNDYGEHWFDNWEDRKRLKKRAEKAGYKSEDLLIINPERFIDKHDGPCHSNKLRKIFWTDILQSMTLSLDFICEEAIVNNRHALRDERIPHLRDRIVEIKQRYSEKQQ